MLSLLLILSLLKEKMGKIELQQLYIILDRSEAVYWAGEVISGRCVIVLSGELDTSQFVVKLVGTVKVECVDDKKGGGRKTVYRRPVHDYLNFSYRPPERKIFSKVYFY